LRSLWRFLWSLRRSCHFTLFWLFWVHNLSCCCCRSKPTDEQRQATRGAGRLPGLLVGPDPSVNGLKSGTRPGFRIARRATWSCTWSGRCYTLVSCINRHI
jgi:hypothetical protein